MGLVRCGPWKGVPASGERDLSWTGATIEGSGTVGRSTSSALWDDSIPSTRKRKARKVAQNCIQRSPKVVVAIR